MSPMTDQQNDFQAGQDSVSTCPNCGMPVEAGNAFCQSCGTPLTPFAQQQRQQQEAAWARQRQQQQQQQPQPQPQAAQPQAGAWQQPGQPGQPGQQPFAQQQPYGQQAPYGQQGFSQVPVDSKSKVAAGLLAIFLGSLGIHKFYLGYNTAGVVMLLVSIIGGIVTLGIATGIMSLIAFIEGIIYFTKTDEQFYYIYVAGRKTWF